MQKPVVLLQGALVVILLAVTAAGITAQDVPVPMLGAGVWSTTLGALYVIGVVVVRRSQEKEPWRPAEARPAGQTARGAQGTTSPTTSRSLRGIVGRTVAAGLIVVDGGIASARTADALAVQTGLGAKFVGFVLGGCVTSLPELSSTVTATRLRQYEMAFADAFGTNLCSLALLFLADLVYAGRPVLNEVGQFSLFATLLGIALTTIYLAGLIVRLRRSRLRMGIDSIVVLCISALGLVLLYRLR